MDSQDPAPVAVQLPSGDYLVTVRSTDSFPAGLAGEWHLLFEPGGSYRLMRNGAMVVMGEYKIAGDTLRLVDKVGTMACTADPAGTYMWKADAEGGLTLMAVEDRCVGRSKITTLRPLMRVKKE
jgi:hypothetical protein